MMKMLEKCNYCGKLFIKKGNANRYCSQSCKHESQLESKRRYSNKRNIRKSCNTRIKNITELGSWGTSSTSHRKPNFNDELRSVKAQIRMLRIWIFFIFFYTNLLFHTLRTYSSFFLTQKVRKILSNKDNIFLNILSFYFINRFYQKKY